MWARWINSPVVRPAAVTKVAWARLTMPPWPVTMTKDRKISDRHRPLAMTPTQKLLARTMTYRTRKPVATTQGRARRHCGTPSR